MNSYVVVVNCYNQESQHAYQGIIRVLAENEEKARERALEKAKEKPHFESIDRIEPGKNYVGPCRR